MHVRRVDCRLHSTPRYFLFNADLPSVCFDPQSLNATASFMWRSNVLRVRRSFSALPYGQCTSRCLSSSVVEPIGEQEFLKAFKKVSKGTKRNENATVGLGISGGVDSMALATLYTKALVFDRSMPRCYGIVIDHKARPESTEEAQWVAEQLRSKLNMKSTVIPLTWPDNFNPHDPTQFESQARILRYQALGIECKRQGIKSLLVAHHKDDQAETVCMRLIQMRWRTGLQGMHPIDPIPECHGLHGVHHSSTDLGPSYTQIPQSNLPFPVETGGIQILRPLLGIGKDRLVRTCEEYGISWAEDKTNADPSLTRRNAVRHIFSNYKLPAALSQDAMLTLSTKMQSRVESYENVVNSIWKNIPMILELRTGSVTVQFPQPSVLLGGRPVATKADEYAARNTACLLLNRLVQLVRPKDRSVVGQLSGAVDEIWPSLRTDDKALIRNGFATNGIWFRTVDDTCATEAEDSHKGFSGVKWMLTRQPMTVAERKSVPITLSPAASRPDLAAWQLFDNRYWIRVENRTADDLVIRTLTRKEYENLGKDETGTESRLYSPDRHLYMKAALNLLDPPDLRFVVPAIFRRDQITNSETLIALPTLGAHIVDSHGNDIMGNTCEYSIRYKKIDIAPRGFSDVIGQDLSHSDIKLKYNQLALIARRKRQIQKNIEREQCGLTVGREAQDKRLLKGRPRVTSRATR